MNASGYNVVMTTKLLLTLGANSSLPSYRYSQLDRGVVEAVRLYGSKQAADYAIAAGISMKSLLKLLQIGLRG